MPRRERRSGEQYDVEARATVARLARVADGPPVSPRVWYDQTPTRIVLHLPSNALPFERLCADDRAIIDVLYCHTHESLRRDLRPRSPKNGNILAVGRRLSATWPTQSANWEGRDWWQPRQSPPLAGFSVGPGAGTTYARMPGWSERIRTRAFLIEPGLCVSFLEFWNMAFRTASHVPAGSKFRLGKRGVSWVSLVRNS